MKKNKQLKRIFWYVFWYADFKLDCKSGREENLNVFYDVLKI